MIQQTNLYPATPSTTRGSLTFLSYDNVNNRIAYVIGKSVIVTSLDKDPKFPPIQFTKHNVTATTASFSPSGNYVASGDESGNVKIWDTSVYGKDISFEQPSVKSEFQVLGGPIKSIAWDADNSRVIAAGNGKEKFAHCFTWDTGNSVGEIQGHSETINAVDIKPQRPYRAATVSDDKALVFFNGPPFKFNKSLRGHHTNTIRAVKFSPDGKWIVSVGSDRIIVVYDGNTGDFVKKIENAHEGGIFGVSWFADLSSFITASADNSLKRWTVDGLKDVGIFELPAETSVDNQQVGVVVTKDFVLSLSLNGTLNFFDHEGKYLYSTYGHQRGLTKVATTSENKVITGSSDGSLRSWAVQGDQLDLKCAPFTNGSHSNYITGILESNEKLITSGWDDKIKAWNYLELEKATALTGQPKCVIQVANSLVVLYENNLEVYNLDFTKTASYSLDFVASFADVIPNTHIVLITNESGKKIEEYNVEADAIQHIRSWPELRAAPTLVKVSPDGQYAAVAETTGKYTLFDTKETKSITTRWAFHSSRVNDAAWTPDSKYLVSGGLDCGLFMYSVARPVKVLKAQLTHQTGVSGLSWITYDGQKGSFVSVGLDGMVKTWVVDFSSY